MIPLNNTSKKGSTVGSRFSWPYLVVTLTLFCIWFPNPLQAQTPSDALMMPSKNICVLFAYDMGSFDRYWEGGYLRSNETIATVDRNTVLPMAAIGILDDLNFYIGLPFISTDSSEPNGGKFTGARGFQDIGFALKYRAVQKTLGNGELSVLTTAGFSTPLTNYLSDYKPYSIGSGAPEFSLRAISQYQLSNGWFVRGSLAHLWRGYTEAERDYYYNNGSYYTAWMDVPNAWTYEGIVGKWFFDYSFKLEFNYTGLDSTSGDDIRAYNAAQPTNKVKFDRIGLSAQYYFKSLKGLGVVAYHNRIIDGRNMPKLSNTGFGITYQFNPFKKPIEVTDDVQ
ncbi:transporter [Flagellimonas alvinocaridis]|uniref:transporter n=1 Tax=Flagellimonas alvinocaridis TaxID=2530200 RepID=UPI00191C349C|nr:transporter [Allomuricauda alvinocaridis]